MEIFQCLWRRFCRSCKCYARAAQTWSSSSNSRRRRKAKASRDREDTSTIFRIRFFRRLTHLLPRCPLLRHESIGADDCPSTNEELSAKVRRFRNTGLGGHQEPNKSPGSVLYPADSKRPSTD